MGSEHQSTESQTTKSKTTSKKAPTEQHHEATHSYERFWGNRALNYANGGAPFNQAKLAVGATNDKYEREADTIADRVMGMPETGHAHPRQAVSRIENSTVQRMCSKCQNALEEEKKYYIQRKPCQSSAEPCAPQSDIDIPVLFKKHDNSSSAESSNNSHEGINALRGGGRPLNTHERRFFEPRFNHDFSHVRLHDNPAAAQAASSINARAFTIGRHIAFGKGEYRSGEASSKHLLAHELTHVLQQQAMSDKRIQRTVHGPGTPTNCHNWRIPLPPWIAGTIAHGQIDAMLGIPPMAIPRATKLLMGMPPPPVGTPYGFADLWEHGAPAIGIGEIKSTATGPTVAQAQAGHYIRRHREWLARSPWVDSDDLTYATITGGPLNARPLDLSSRTGTGRSLGPFWGDPLKILHVEGDSMGAVVYWCTGSGLPFSPLWYPVFREAMRRARDQMRDTQRFAEQVLAPLVAHATAAFISIANAIRQAVEWVAENSLFLAFVLVALFVLAALIIALAGIFFAPESGGTSLALTFAGAGAMIIAIGALVTVIEGQGSDGPAQVAARNLADTFAADADTRPASGAEYEREAENGPPFPSTAQSASEQTSDPSQAFLASLQPLTNPATLIQSAASSRTTASADDIQQLQSAIAMLEQAGDPTTAARARQYLTAMNIG